MSTIAKSYVTPISHHHFLVYNFLKNCCHMVLALTTDKSVNIRFYHTYSSNISFIDIVTLPSCFSLSVNDKAMLKGSCIDFCPQSMKQPNSRTTQSISFPSADLFQLSYAHILLMRQAVHVLFIKLFYVQPIRRSEKCKQVVEVAFLCSSVGFMQKIKNHTYITQKINTPI